MRFASVRCPACGGPYADDRVLGPCSVKCALALRQTERTNYMLALLIVLSIVGVCYVLLTVFR